MDSVAVEEKTGYSVTRKVEKAKFVFDSWEEDTLEIVGYNKEENELTVSLESGETITIEKFDFTSVKPNDRYYLLENL